MNAKFFINTAVVFVAAMILGMLVHGMLLNADYSQVPILFRTPDESRGYMPFLLLAHAVIAGTMVWLYRKGKEAKAFLGQGIRFGLAIALIMNVGMYLIYYAVQPMPGMLVAKQIIFDTIGTTFLGVLIAWLERK